MAGSAIGLLLIVVVVVVGRAARFGMIARASRRRQEHPQLGAGKRTTSLFWRGKRSFARRHGVVPAALGSRGWPESE
jgi:hypothetical protein